MRYCLTLVHGTFAPDAAWTAPGSAFRRALAAGLGASGQVEFDVPTWRGWLGSRFNNSHRYRTAAGAALADHLRATRPDDEDVSRFVIAHSHGGNAVLYALRDDAVRDTIAGVVCLGTPFIESVPRDYKSIATGVEYAVNFGFLLLSIGLTVVAWRWASSPTLTGPVGAADIPFVLGLLVWLGLLVVSSAYLSAVLSGWHRSDGWSKRQHRTLEKLRTPRLTELPPLFCARAQGNDEPGIGLWLQQTLAALPFMTFSTQPYYVAAVATMWVGAIGLLVLALATPAFTLVGIPEDGSRQSVLQWLLHAPYGSLTLPQWASLLFKVLAVIGAIISGPLFLVFGVLLGGATLHFLLVLVVPKIRSNALGFGWETIADNLFTDTRAQPVPSGLSAKDTDRTYPVPALFPGILFGRLKHSLYDHSRVQTDVAAWIVAHALREPERKTVIRARIELRRVRTGFWTSLTDEQRYYLRNQASRASKRYDFSTPDFVRGERFREALDGLIDEWIERAQHHEIVPSD